MLETTALGAACLAGLTVNLWPSRDAFAERWQVDRRFEPSMPREEANARIAEWRQTGDHGALHTWLEHAVGDWLVAHIASMDTVTARFAAGKLAAGA